MVNIFLEQKVDINTTDLDGESPLWTACRRGYHDIVELLLNHELTQQICNVNFRKASNGQTPLFVAAHYGNLAIVKSLIEYKAMKCDVDIGDSHDRTPLLRACHKGKEEIVKLLLENGADINAVNDCLRSPLMVAFKLNKAKICKILLNNDFGDNKKQIILWKPDIEDKYILDHKTRKSDKKIAKQIETVLHTVLQSAIQEFKKDLPSSIVTVICYMTY